MHIKNERKTPDFLSLSGQELMQVLILHRLEFNEFRQQHPGWLPDLGNAQARGVNLEEIDFSRLDLSRVSLQEALLSNANLCCAKLGQGNLHKARLTGTKICKNQLGQLATALGLVVEK
jgi:uncharacterized protein YjbI with pentapeptide repeats